jgi:hypothetical protein
VGSPLLDIPRTYIITSPNPSLRQQTSFLGAPRQRPLFYRGTWLGEQRVLRTADFGCAKSLASHGSSLAQFSTFTKCKNKNITPI